MDMRIDYAMAMTMFRDFLFQVKFTMQLHEKHAAEQKVESEAAGHKQ
jgi:hypothetical protein